MINLVCLPGSWATVFISERDLAARGCSNAGARRCVAETFEAARSVFTNCLAGTTPYYLLLGAMMQGASAEPGKLNFCV